MHLTETDWVNIVNKRVPGLAKVRAVVGKDKVMLTVSTQPGQAHAGMTTALKDLVKDYSGDVHIKWLLV